MKLTRRGFGFLSFGAAAIAAGVRPAMAAGGIDEAIAAFTGGARPAEGAISVSAPEIAENGNTVPVGFSIDLPVDQVKEVAMFADGNPSPGIGSFKFGKIAAKAQASTRIRLAKTQNVYAVATLADGSAIVAKREVKVTIGGCGG